MPTKPESKPYHGNWLFIFDAAKLPGKALHVATALLLQGLVCRSTILEWDAHYGEHLGLTYAAFYRGLKTLEGAKLVAVNRRPGRPPIVTLRMRKPPKPRKGHKR